MMLKMRSFSDKSGFTLIEIMIVVAIIGLLAAIAVPNFMIAREKVRTTACIANLKQIDGAMTLWALGGDKVSTDMVTMADLVPDYLKTTPSCPAGGTYDVVAGIQVGTTPTCTISDHTLTP